MTRIPCVTTRSGLIVPGLHDPVDPDDQVDEVDAPQGGQGDLFGGEP